MIAEISHQLNTEKNTSTNPEPAFEEKKYIHSI